MGLEDVHFENENVVSLDGTKISYRVIGKGPSLVVVHGMFRTAENYDRLCRCLADSFTVYAMNRRGRGNSGNQGSDYSLQKEQEDTIAVLRKAQSTFLFGHSFGGMVGLDVALSYPLKKLAVYEPGVPLNGWPQIEWLLEYEKTLTLKNYTSALKLFFKGVGAEIPDEHLEVMIHPMLQGPNRKETIRLMSTLVNEFKTTKQADSTLYKYKGITTETLLLTGTENHNFLNSGVFNALETVIPNRKSMILQGFDHIAPDMSAPEQIAQVLKDFFQ
jgi:pimeloyl-ACP methyl ester carboxylesterase